MVVFWDFSEFMNYYIYFTTHEGGGTVGKAKDKKSKILYENYAYPEWRKDVFRPFLIIVAILLALMAVFLFSFYISHLPIFILGVLILGSSLSILLFIPVLFVLDEEGIHSISILSKKLKIFYPYENIQEVLILKNAIRLKIRGKYGGCQYFIIYKKYLPNVEYVLKIFQSKKKINIRKMDTLFMFKIFVKNWFGVEIASVLFWYLSLLVYGMVSPPPPPGPIISPILISLFLSSLFLVYALFKIVSENEIKNWDVVEKLIMDSHLFILFVLLYYPLAEGVYFRRIENFIVIPFILIYGLVLGIIVKKVDSKINKNIVGKNQSASKIKNR